MMQVAIKSHYSASELAAMQLPGMPTTRANIRAKAERESWPLKESKSSGRTGSKFEFSPPESVMSLIREKATQELVKVAAPAALPAPRRRPEQMPLIETDAQRLTADARKGVLLALDLLMQRTGYSHKKAATALLDSARAGVANEQLVSMLKMARDERGRQSLDGLPSVRSLLRFLEYDRAGELAPRVRQADLSIPAWAPLFLRHYQAPEKPSVEHAYRLFIPACAVAFPAQVEPSVHQVRRFLAKMGNVSREIGRMGPRELKNIKPFVRRTFDDMLPGEVYSADGHCFDAEVQHPLHGRPFRPEITSIVDIATRRVVGWSIGLAESSLAVLDAIRHACISCGIPAIFYVDNGSGYKNQLMNDVATGFMARLGISMENSLPYNSQARGVIERLHQTLWIAAARELPTYIGKDMDREAKLAMFKMTRKAIQGSKSATLPLMAWSRFMEFCGEKVEEYNNRPHRSLPKIIDHNTGRKRHMSPNEAWAQHQLRGFEPHLVADDESRPLFRPQELRAVTRGEINLFGNRYFSRELTEFHGERLRVAYDIHDASVVWVYDNAGRFVCRAEFEANAARYFPKSATEAAAEKRMQGRLRRAEATVEEITAEGRGHQAIEHVEAVDIGGMQVSLDELAQRARQIQTIEATTIKKTIEPQPMPTATTAGWVVPETAEGRWAEWQQLSAMREGEITSEKARFWRQSYQKTAEFRVYQKRTA